MIQNEIIEHVPEKLPEEKSITTKKNPVNTGDNTSLSGWFSTLGICGVVLVCKNLFRYKIHD